jgi:hypothetical protein
MSITYDRCLLKTSSLIRSATYRGSGIRLLSMVTWRQFSGYRSSYADQLADLQSEAQMSRGFEGMVTCVPLGISIFSPRVFYMV